MKLTLLTFVLSGLALCAGTPQTITGTVTDTMCGVKHNMTKGQADDECIRTCVKGAREYALDDGKTIWKLSDQKAPASFAAKTVKVTGIADPKTRTIKVSSIEPSE
jgi:hypothetical protein